MYFRYEQIHQTVDYNIKLGKLCVIISLEGRQLCIHFNTANFLKGKIVQKMVDIFRQIMSPNHFRILR